MSEEFESTRKSGPTWQPTHSGKKKDNNIVHHKADDKSYLIGYFIGSEQNQGPNNESTIHKFKLKSVGDESRLSEPCNEGDEVSIWGSMVLNDNISKVTPGSFVKITWEGKKQPKKGGNEYHSWDVGVSKKTEPLKLSASANVTETISNATATATASKEEEEDDMPF